MRFLLDTDTCVALIRRRPAQLMQRLFALQPGAAGVSSVTVAELSCGVWRSRDPARNGDALERFLAPLAVAPFDEGAARVYGRVRAALEAAGQTIGAMDLLIGAHALQLSVTLITHNTREFSRIPGLGVEDWLASEA